MKVDQTKERLARVNEINANYRRVPTEFGPESRFDIRPLAAGPFHAVQTAELKRLERRLLTERLGEVLEPNLVGYVRAAAHEAASLAWATPYPSLVFPILFEEKTDAALRRAERQEQVRQLSRALLAA
jgi:hypothetical protein